MMAALEKFSDSRLFKVQVALSVLLVVSSFSSAFQAFSWGPEYLPAVRASDYALLLLVLFSSFAHVFQLYAHYTSNAPLLRISALITAFMGLLASTVWLWYLISVVVLGVLSPNGGESGPVMFLSLLNVATSFLMVLFLFVASVLSWSKAAASLNPELSQLRVEEPQGQEGERDGEVYQETIDPITGLPRAYEQNFMEDERLFAL